MQVVVPDDSNERVVGPPGATYGMTDYLGDHTVGGAGPQAYRVRQHAGELRAHFHEVDQFQVVVAGAGTLGRDVAAPGVVHYVDAWTSYGPIRTDPGVGLTYLTLRRTGDSGIHYMPGERERRRLAAGAGQHFTTAVDLDGPTGARTLARTERGAAAYAVRLAAGARIDTGDLPSGSGGFAVVLDGAARVLETVVPASGLVAFDDPAELSDLVGAAEGGTSLAVLVFAPGLDRPR